MKILIVEDEVKLAEAISRGLVHQGYTTDIITDGKKALTRISLHRDDYDLVILDLMLPGMDGLEVCKTAREMNVSIPILILTARAETENKVKLLLSGADDYVVKPFSLAELLARVHALLRRPNDSLPQSLTIRDIELKPAERVVTKNGEEVPLTLKEFSLLEYLLRHQQQVVSREDLLSHLWDFNYESFSNVVDVHVKNLRKKLDTNGSPSLIETIRGIGYRVRA